MPTTPSERGARAALLLGLVAAACAPRETPSPAPADGTATSTTHTSTTHTSTVGTASVAAAPAPPPPAPPPGPRLVLESDLTALEVRLFRRRARLKLPRYRDAMQTHARQHGFDWRLIASVAYVESHWDPLAKSFTGVRGLMQLTGNTARAMGVTNRLDPFQSIGGGVRYLARMHGLFGQVVEFHRTMIAMASYNVGYGHVRDAQRMVRWTKKDPNAWPNLARQLPRLSDPEVAKHTRYGQARGEEPVAYVRSICNYFVLQKRDACRRRAALGDMVLGDRPTPQVTLPEDIAKLERDGVVTLSWSHPYACGMSDCAVLLQEAHVRDPGAAAEGGGGES